MSQRWVSIGKPESLRFAPGAAVKVEGHWLAIFPLDDGFTALDNACPHAGAPLCDGAVLNGKVVCFLHLWEFDLRTGACDTGKEWNVQTYPVRVQDGELLVGLPA